MIVGIYGERCEEIFPLWFDDSRGFRDRVFLVSKVE